jgi:hypothetical protein
MRVSVKESPFGYRQGKPLQIHDLLAELRRYIEVRPKLQNE